MKTNNISNPLCTHQHGQPGAGERFIAVLLELLHVVHHVKRDERACASDKQLAEHHQDFTNSVHHGQINHVGLDQVDGLARRLQEAGALYRHLMEPTHATVQHSSATSVFKGTAGVSRREAATYVDEGVARDELQADLDAPQAATDNLQNEAHGLVAS